MTKVGSACSDPSGRAIPTILDCAIAIGTSNSGFTATRIVPSLPCPRLRTGPTAPLRGRDGTGTGRPGAVTFGPRVTGRDRGASTRQREALTRPHRQDRPARGVPGRTDHGRASSDDPGARRADHRGSAGRMRIRSGHAARRDADSDRAADFGGHAHRIAGSDRFPDTHPEADSNAEPVAGWPTVGRALDEVSMNGAVEDYREDRWLRLSITVTGLAPGESVSLCATGKYSVTWACGVEPEPCGELGCGPTSFRNTEGSAKAVDDAVAGSDGTAVARMEIGGDASRRVLSHGLHSAVVEATGTMGEGQDRRPCAWSRPHPRHHRAGGHVLARLRTGRSAPFAGWDAHRASGGDIRARPHEGRVRRTTDGAAREPARLRSQHSGPAKRPGARGPRD